MLYKKPLFTKGFSLFLVLVVIILTTLIYGNSVHTALEEEADTYMEELAQQSARLIYERVKSDQTYLEGLAASISKLDTTLAGSHTLDILSQWIVIPVLNGWLLLIPAARSMCRTIRKLPISPRNHTSRMR